MNKKHALALGAFLISASAMAQQSAVAPMPAESGFQLGRPAFLTQEQLEALAAQQSGQPAPAAAKRSRKAPAAEASSEASAPAQEASPGKGIPLPPLPPLAAGGKTAEPEQAANQAAVKEAGASKSSSASAQPEAPPADTRRVFDGRPETTPAQLQWGYDTINRQEARWAEREAEYSRRYSTLSARPQTVTQPR